MRKTWHERTLTTARDRFIFIVKKYGLEVLQKQPQMTSSPVLSYLLK